MSQLIEGSIEKYARNLIRRTDIEDALKRLDKQTHEEARMVTAENLKATHTVGESVRGVTDKVVAINNRVASMDDRVAGVDNRVAGMGNAVTSVDGRVRVVNDRVAEVIRSV